MTATRFDPEDTLGAAALRVTGWAWYRLDDSMLFLVGTDSADIRNRPAFMNGTPPPFWRLSDLANVVENGDEDPWRVQVARQLLRAVVVDLAEDSGFGSAQA